MGLQFRTLTSNDILFERNKIKEISGLVFDENTRDFKISSFPYLQKKEKVQKDVSRSYPKKSKLLVSLDEFAKDHSKRPTR
jgi:hypothetical protein